MCSPDVRAWLERNDALTERRLARARAAYYAAEAEKLAAERARRRAERWSALMKFAGGLRGMIFAPSRGGARIAGAQPAPHARRIHAARAPGVAPTPLRHGAQLLRRAPRAAPAR